MNIKWMTFFLATTLLVSCEFHASTKSNKESKEISSSEDRGPLGGATIKNDIELDASNVKVKEAYLMNDARMILDKNEVKLGEKVHCVVVLDTGWTKQEGKSYLGASEKILTETGNVVLDVPDLFNEYDKTGISPNDAETVSLSANITQKQPGVDNYKVQFKIWDKKGTGEVTGRFKFKVN